MEDITNMPRTEFLRETEREEKMGVYLHNESVLDVVYSVIKYFFSNGEVYGFSVTPSGDNDVIIKIRVPFFMPETLDTFRAMNRKVEEIKIVPLDSTEDFCIEVKISGLWLFESGEGLDLAGGEQK